MMKDTHAKNPTKSIDFAAFSLGQNIRLMLQHRRHRRYLLIIGLLTLIPFSSTFIRLIRHSSFFDDPSDHLPFPQVRPNKTDRRFTSPAVESLIKEIKRTIQNKQLAWLFENCFANTLDTTVDFDIKAAAENHSDTYVISGDIDAMWLRDSSAQIHPYLPLMKNDSKLRQLVEGVLRRQFICIQRDPYANAFYKDLTRISEWKDIDQTEMVEGVHERKWQLDSLCYVLRLINSYWMEVNYDLTFFMNNKDEFHRTLRLIVQTLKDQRRYNGSGIYTFQRRGQPPDPRGRQARPNGLIYSYFRPSGDLQSCAYLIPSQYFAYHTLKMTLKLVEHLNWTADFSFNINSITNDLSEFLFHRNIKRNQHTLITGQQQEFGWIYAYEVDGVGNQNFMDDANIPSLLSLPYLCPDEISVNDTTYQNTRKFVLSRANPWYYTGEILQGIGGANVGFNMVWPLGIIMRALTSIDDNEIRLCLKMLQSSHADTGLMHQASNADDPSRYTRPWFGWANSLFGELIWKLYREKRYLLNENSLQKKD